MSNAAASAPQARYVSLYVYYRVPKNQEAAVRAAIEAMQATLRDVQPGLHARLMCRADTAAQADEATWMEVYEHPDGLSKQCRAQLAMLSQALPEGLTSARHTEIFCPLAPAAKAHT
jgi:hypothetical protein